MAETGCLRNVAYNHLSVQGNLTSGSKNIKTFREGSEVGLSRVYNLTVQDSGIILLGNLGDAFEDDDDGFTIILPKIKINSSSGADGTIPVQYPSDGLIFEFVFAGNSIGDGPVDNEIIIKAHPYDDADDVTDGDNRFVGWISHHPDGGASPTAIRGAANNTVTFKKTISHGDTCKIIGTKGRWYILARTHAALAITVTNV